MLLALYRHPLLWATLLNMLIVGTLVGRTAAASPHSTTQTPITFSIQDDAVQPLMVTVAVGMEVVWTNDTGAPIQIGDQPFAGDSPLFMPFITGGAGTQTPNQHMAPYWRSNEIAPGSEYRHSYPEAGEFQFYVSHLPLLIGTVVVVANDTGSSQLIEAEQGGVVASGNSTLEIPPNAIGQDTLITVTHPQQGMTLAQDGLEYVHFEPAGLTFSKPVTLTLHYSNVDEMEEDFIGFVLSNETTGEWEVMPIHQQEKAENSVSVAIPHFSWGTRYTDAPIYITMKIPGQYLRPGDILMRMDTFGGGSKPDCSANNADWLPGHTAIFSESYGVSSDQNWLIESNTFGEVKRYACWGAGGVREVTMQQLLDESCAFYMGARRPVNVTANIQQSARNFAAAQMDKGYFFTGQGNDDGTCYSCVGLVEDAYDTVGASIIPDKAEQPFITPLQMYKATVPVDEIHVKVDDAIEIPIQSVVQVRDLIPYYKPGNQVGAKNLPSGSTFSGGVFHWKPQAEELGKQFDVEFVATANIGLLDIEYTATQTLRIVVDQPANRAPNAPLNPRPRTGALYRPTVLVLNWTGNDPDDESLLYDLYLEANDATPDVKVASRLSQNSFDLNGLAQNTTYFWQVVSTDMRGISTSGPVWTFNTAVPGPEPVLTQIDGGRYHTCAIKSGGGVMCWGRNYEGQIGDGTNEQRLAPVAVNGLSSGVAMLAIGDYHSCALKNSGVLCWGDNKYGQLGDDITITRTVPTSVDVLGSNVATIAAGDYHTCAIIAGRVYCWGWNYAGQLGNGTFVNSSAPVAVTGLSNIVALSAATSHTCVLTSGGGVKCWGRNTEGQLGNGTLISSTIPVDVVGMQSGVVAVAARSNGTCALTSGGDVKCWGVRYEQVGETEVIYHPVLETVSGLESEVIVIVAGEYHTCALTSGGGVKCWGDNGEGQLGDDGSSGLASETPVNVLGLTSGMTKVGTGTRHSCAAVSGGGAFCWGYGYYGGLGDGQGIGFRDTPERVLWP